MPLFILTVFKNLFYDSSAAENSALEIFPTRRFWIENVHAVPARFHCEKADPQQLGGDFQRGHVGVPGVCNDISSRSSPKGEAALTGIS